MFEEINIEDTIKIIWNFKTSKEFPYTYEIISSACPNPFCPCEWSKLEFINENIEKPISLEFDIQN